MSKFLVENGKCNICGRENEITLFAMGAQKGTDDLDYRPAEDRRSAMPLWVRRCDYCRNVFSTTEPMPEYEEKYIDSKEYVNCGNIPDLSDLGKRFVKLALIYQHVGDFRKAGDNFLTAAWVCDDEHRDVTAIVCRKRALKCYNEVDGKDINKREIPEFMLRIVDILRRSAMYDEAIAFAKQCIVSTELEAKTRDFQIELAKKHDVACYRFEDVIGEE